jgi:peptidyl-prolyl cis-trans isomerase NIMA-interacting 1
VRHSQSRNLPYYYNPTEQSSRWEPPAGTDVDKLKDYMAKYQSTSTGNLEAAASDRAGKIRAAHLLVKHKESRNPKSWRDPEIKRTKEEARETLEQHEKAIRNGDKTLSALAKKESDCPSAFKYGDLGWFGKGDMQREFEEAAFALKPGEMSGIVETPSGLHLIERFVLCPEGWELGDGIADKLAVNRLE